MTVIYDQIVTIIINIIIIIIIISIIVINIIISPRPQPPKTTDIITDDHDYPGVRAGQ